MLFELVEFVLRQDVFSQVRGTFQVTNTTPDAHSRESSGLGALGTTRGLVVLFAILALTFFLLAFGALSHNTGLARFGGVVGLITAARAWYLSIAGVLASTFDRQILPNPRMSRS